MNYFNISVFTLEKNKEAIINDVKKNSIEEAPMVWFVKFEGNKEMTEWIDKVILEF